MYRITVFRNTGEKCAELEAVIPRSWVLNRAGQAQFTLPASGPYFRGDVLRYGNYLLVESDTVPTWGGVIVSPLGWSVGSCTFTAFSAEALLQGRWTVRADNLHGNPGEIFEQLIHMVNAHGGYPIRVGSVWKGGLSHVHKVRGEMAYDNLAELSDNTGGDWWVEPVEEGGRLAFYAHWAQQRGLSTNFALHLDVNCELPSGEILSRQGPIVNYIYAYGQGVNWKEAPHVDVRDDASIARYGLWQAFIQYAVKDEAGLIEAATAELARTSELFSPYSVVALPVGDAYKYLRPGNFVDLILPGVGFNPDGTVGVATRARVTGMSYDETDGKMPVILAEVTE